MRAVQFNKAGVKMAVMVAVMTVFVYVARAADVTWSTPTAISGDADVVASGALDRAYSMGTTGKVVAVNGVLFTPFGAKAAGDDFTDGQTTVAISGDGDGLASDAAILGNGLTSFSPYYRAILQSSLFDHGSALALTLHGLTVGSTYLIQSWTYDPQGVPWTETLTGGANTSAAIKYNSTETLSGLGQFVVGTFIADSTSQTVIYTPNGGDAQINAFQLRVVADAGALAILKQPLSVTSFLTKAARLSVFANGKPPLTYQWQKITSVGTNNLVDGGGISGATSNILNLSILATDDAGDYQAVVKGASNSVTSQTAKVTVLLPPTNQLINVAINDGSPTAYKGIGVLAGTPNDVWNSPDARNSFARVALVDSAGMTTPVTMTLSKNDGGAVRNGLLGGVGFASIQTVILHNLKPNSFYNLVVFSAGNVANEGGVFSGAIGGISHGYDAPDRAAGGFVYGTNYVENPFALSDGRGTLLFVIEPTATVVPNGYFNGDFNGLQLLKLPDGGHPPVILQQPASLASYAGHRATLAVVSASPPSSPLAYQWQKITAATTNNMADGGGVSGSTTSALTFDPITADNIGAYQVVITNSSGAITSIPANISEPTNQFINVAINDGSTAPHKRAAVLTGSTNDIWNSPDGRSGFSNVSLVDSAGTATPVTLTLVKTSPKGKDIGAVPNSLLGDVSFATGQTVTLNNLEPNTLYDLVVFSVGNMANEGGVFSGAVTGIARGFPANGIVSTNFVYGTNYVENPYALSDAHGTLAFNISPTATVVPDGYPNGDFNGLQLKKVRAGDCSPVIMQQPASVAAYLRHPLTLSVVVASPPSSPVTYQWQKITAIGTDNLVDDGNVSGSTTNTLFFKAVTADDAGNYQLKSTSSAGAITSSVASVKTLKNQLVNVAVNDGSTAVHRGMAVLDGAANDVWNSPDGRNGFRDARLVDSKGNPATATLTLSKTKGGAVRNSLLGNVSFATGQTVTLNNLEPNTPYDLVVFSVGNVANEGGVFSGAVTGIARGYPANDVVSTNFDYGTNYVENSNVMSDSRGTLSFTIKPTATVIPKGHFNCDFNGLQLMELMPEDSAKNKTSKTP